MPEYLAPGVYVEESSSLTKSIEGVSTSTAGMVGPTPKGPSQPTLVTSWSEYQQVFGAAEDHEGTYLPYAARGFYENGGTRLCVARVARTDDTQIYDASIFVGDIDAATQIGTGLTGLAEVDEISIVTIPDAVNEQLIADAAERDVLVDALVKHCEHPRYRLAILNVPAGSQDANVIRPKIDSSRAAAYFPWLHVSAFDGTSTVLVPPSGHVAGVYARTDVERGVHKVPANAVVRGVPQVAAALEFDLTNEEQGVFNKLGINAIRHFSGRGVLVWGARTLSSDPEWKYVNIRRLLYFLEESIDEGIQWVIFEPNGQPLWDRVRRSIESFLTIQWRAGALQGATPKEAYFVGCDRSTMTQNDIDNGRLVCEVGVAPLKPAEFVVFRIDQKTADTR